MSPVIRVTWLRRPSMRLPAYRYYHRSCYVYKPGDEVEGLDLEDTGVQAVCSGCMGLIHEPPHSS